MKGQLSRMEMQNETLQAMRKKDKKDHKKEIADLKGQLSRMEMQNKTLQRMLMEEREDHKKDIADLKAMMQQMLANQQQNGNAQ
ncbi:uncharacterized protein [Argopecten irradians]|uniref:uncharacterized protein isoform X4 n=1 Tax=Argopecten irradians TaxID=31199 RepID=UPI003723F207